MPSYFRRLFFAHRRSQPTAAAEAASDQSTAQKITVYSAGDDAHVPHGFAKSQFLKTPFLLLPTLLMMIITSKVFRRAAQKRRRGLTLKLLDDTSQFFQALLTTSSSYFAVLRAKRNNFDTYRD